MSSPFRPPIIEESGVSFYLVEGDTAFQWMLLLHFAQAIATFEGFYIDGSKAQRNNNPGNLRPIGASTGFRVFETANQGWERLVNQIEINVKRGLTLEEFFLGKKGVYPGYAPLGDNPEDVMENYLNFMSKQTGIPRDAILLNYFPMLGDTDIRTGLMTRWRPPRYQNEP